MKIGMKSAANGASLPVLWLTRLVWVLVGAVAPWTEVASGRSTAVAAVITVSGWSLWGAVLVAILVPSAISLTVARIVGPLGLVAAVADGRWASITVAVSFLALLSLPDTNDALVQGGAYGAETRFVLRTPVAYVLPAVVAWSLLCSAVLAGPLLLAARAWVPGVLVTAAGGLLAWKVPVRLHRLSRRWLVLVPAGVVVHDHIVLAETMMLRRSNVDSVAVTADGGDAADLTGGVFGRRVRIAMKNADKVILSPITSRVLGTGEALHVQTFVTAPRRAVAAAAALVRPAG